MSDKSSSLNIVHIVNGKIFHYSTIAIIIIACIIIGVETNREFYAIHYWWLHLLDRIVISLFAVELIMRYIAEVKTSEAIGSAKYLTFFTDAWHIIDIIVVLVCLIPQHTEYLAVLRTLRILRVFLLVDELPRLKILVNALIKSIPSMSYVLLLLMLHFFAYSVIAVELFGVTNLAQFGNIGSSLTTLFQVVTGDGWGEIMETVIQNDKTIPPVVITLYFVSFIIIGAMIGLNLLIGVLTNEIADVKAEDERQKRLEKQMKSQESVDTYIAVLEDQINHISSTLAELKALRNKK